MLVCLRRRAYVFETPRYADPRRAHNPKAHQLRPDVSAPCVAIGFAALKAMPATVATKSIYKVTGSESKIISRKTRKTSPIAGWLLMISVERKKKTSRPQICQAQTPGGTWAGAVQQFKRLAPNLNIEARLLQLWMAGTGGSAIRSSSRSGVCDRNPKLQPERGDLQDEQQHIYLVPKATKVLPQPIRCDLPHLLPEAPPDEKPEDRIYTVKPCR
jgi:hypothetical protein